MTFSPFSEEKLENSKYKPGEARFGENVEKSCSRADWWNTSKTLGGLYYGYDFSDYRLFSSRTSCRSNEARSRPLLIPHRLPSSTALHVRCMLEFWAKWTKSCRSSCAMNMTCWTAPLSPLRAASRLRWSRLEHAGRGEQDPGSSEGQLS